MVRIVAGTLVEVGRGRLRPSDIRAIIESKDRRRAGVTMPPAGLCLEWVRY
jgi:tRNA pseudouridine38-40 synthase